MGTEDLDQIRRLTGELGDLVQQVGAQMYEQPEPASAPEDERPGDESSPDEGDEDVEEGEFEEAS